MDIRGLNKVCAFTERQAVACPMFADIYIVLMSVTISLFAKAGPALVTIPLILDKIPVHAFFPEENGFNYALIDGSNQY